MPFTPVNIPAPLILPATPRTPRPRLKKSAIDPKESYTPTGSAKAACFFQPPIEPLPQITAADRTSPPRDLYKGRGKVDPFYVFSKPPRAQRPCRPCEKQASPKREIKYYPLCTSPGVKVKPSPASPVSNGPEMKP